MNSIIKFIYFKFWSENKLSLYKLNIYFFFNWNKIKFYILDICRCKIRQISKLFQNDRFECTRTGSARIIVKDQGQDKSYSLLILYRDFLIKLDMHEIKLWYLFKVIQQYGCIIY